jgi:hypothetical protein
MKTPEAKYRNLYECPKCGERWEDVWDSMCNDKCPNCDAEIEPYQSITLTDEQTPEVPYIWLQEDEEEGTGDCGCRLVANYEGRGAAIFLCPLHDRAGKTKIALSRIVDAVGKGLKILSEEVDQ